MALPASSPAPGLYARFRAMLPEIMKFLVIGGIGTVIDLGGAGVLNSTYHVEPLAAKAVSVTIATIFTYFGSRFWTFRHRENQAMHREAVLFFVLNVVGLLIAEAVIGLVTYALGLRGAVAYNAASFIGTGLGTIFRFYAYRKWVFLDPAAQAEAPSTLAGAPAVPDYPPWELDPAFLAPPAAAAQSSAAAPQPSAARVPVPAPAPAPVAPAPVPVAAAAAYVSPWTTAPAPGGPLTVPFAGARTVPFAGARTEPFAGSLTEPFAGSPAEPLAGSPVEPFAGSRPEPFAGSRPGAPVLDARSAFPGGQAAAPPLNPALAAPVPRDFTPAPPPAAPRAPHSGPRPAGRHRKS